MKFRYKIAIAYGVVYGLCRYAGLTPKKVSRYLNDVLTRYGL